MANATEAAPVEAPDIVGLQDGFRGELLRSGDPAYEDARKVWNGSISRFPALIARCAGVADIITAVKVREGQWPSGCRAWRGAQPTWPLGL